METVKTTSSPTKRKEPSLGFLKNFEWGNNRRTWTYKKACKLARILDQGNNRWTKAECAKKAGMNLATFDQRVTILRKILDKKMSIKEYFEKGAPFEYRKKRLA